jgi:hypothetical protein
MSGQQVNDLEKNHYEMQMKRIRGKAKNIEINERTILAYDEEYAKKGMVPKSEDDYPREDFHLVAKQKTFDALVDPSQPIRKVIESMVRQPGHNMEQTEARD